MAVWTGQRIGSEAVHGASECAGAGTGGTIGAVTTTGAVKTTDALSELLNPLSTIAGPSLSPAGIIAPDAAGASLSGLPDAKLEIGVTEEGIPLWMKYDWVEDDEQLIAQYHRLK